MKGHVFKGLQSGHDVFLLETAVWSQLGTNQRNHQVRSLTVKAINSADSVAMEATSLDQTLSKEKTSNSKMLWAEKLCQMLY